MMMADNPAIENFFIVNGFDLIGGGNKSNAATIFVPMKPWEKRKQTAMQLADEVSGKGFRLAGRHRLRLQPAGHTRSGRRRRIRGLRAGPHRSRPAAAGAGDQRLHRRAGQATRRSTGLNTFFRPTVPQLRVEVDREKALVAGRAGERRVRRAAGADGLAVRQRLQQVRPHLPRDDAGRRARTAPSPRTSATSTCARTTTRHDSAQGADQRDRHHRPRADSNATTATSPPRCSAAPSPASARARRSRGRAGRQSDVAAGLQHRMDRPGLPGKAHRQRLGVRLRLRARHGVPDPVGAVRALGRADGGGAGGAVRAAAARWASCSCAAWRTTSTSRSA